MKPAKWKQLDSKELFKNPWLHIRDNVYATEVSDQKEYVIVTLPKGASVLPMDSDGNVYLIKQYRPGYGDITIETPGGKIDDGYTAEETARKETLEEIGVEPKELISLGTIAGLTSNIDHVEHLYVAQIDPVDAKAIGHEDEVLELVVVPFEQAIAWALDSTIVHGPAIALILRAKEYLNR